MSILLHIRPNGCQRKRPTHGVGRFLCSSATSQEFLRWYRLRERHRNLPHRAVVARKPHSSGMCLHAPCRRSADTSVRRSCVRYIRKPPDGWFSYELCSRGLLSGLTLGCRSLGTTISRGGLGGVICRGVGALRHVLLVVHLEQNRPSSQTRGRNGRAHVRMTDT